VLRQAPKMPQDVQVRDKSLSNTQQIGIAVGALLESSKMSLVTWTIEVRYAAASAVVAKADEQVPSPASSLRRRSRMLQPLGARSFFIPTACRWSRQR
jgi:hypothetical protein